jgi:hypothetical protein
MINNISQYRSAAGESDASAPHFERLLQVGKEVKEKRQRMQKQKIKESLNECTFEPTTNHNKKKVRAAG